MASAFTRPLVQSCWRIGVPSGRSQRTPGGPSSPTRLAADPARGGEQRQLAAQPQGAGDEGEERLLARLGAPVHPGEIVVLAVGVVVAALGAAVLVAHQDHRHALADDEDRHREAAHPVAQGEDRGIVGRTLDAAIPRAVVVVAVAVVLAVRLVVLLVPGVEVGQREAVVRGDEVDARPWPPPAPVEDVAGAEEVAGEVVDGAVVALDVGADVVAEAAVPLGPAGREVSDLVAPLPEVPALGDRLDLGEHRVLGDGVEERAVEVDGVAVAGQRHREVEAEAVDVAVLDPVAQRVHHHLHHARVAGVDGVAGAGGVEIVARIVGQHVVAGVVEAAERQGRPELVALGGVVVDDVEDHLDAGLVHPLHHVLELGDVVAWHQVARRRGEEADGVVAPVVREPPLDQVPVVEEGLDRHQLDRGHAEPRQVLDHLRRAEALEGAGAGSGDLRMAGGHALDVGLVDHRLGPAAPQRVVGSPGVGGVDDPALRHRPGAVAAVEREVGLRAADPVAVERVVPAQLAGVGAGVGVEQQLVRIEAVAGLGSVGTVGAQAVELARTQVGEVAVPDLVGELGQRDPLDLAPALGVEQAELDAAGVGGEDRDVHARSVPGGAERERQSGRDTGR